MDKLLSVIGWEFMRTKALVLEDGRYDLVQQQKGFQYINPSENWFPGTYRNANYSKNISKNRKHILFLLIILKILWRGY